MKKIISLLCCLLLVGGWIHGASVVGATLSAQSGIADGNTHVLGYVTTNTGSGTLYYSVSTSCGLTPTAAQIKAGTVTGNVVNGNQAVSATGQQTINPSGVSAVTSYCVYFVHTATADSNVVGTSSFTTPGTVSFTPNIDATFSGAQGGTFTAVLSDVLSYISGCFLPSVNLTNVTGFYDYGTCGGCLGSTGASTATASYSSVVRAKLVGLPNLNTTIQQSLFGNPPANDPTGIGDTYRLPIVNMAAIGQGTIGLPSQYSTRIGSTFSYDTSVPPTNCSSDFCLWLVLFHETLHGIARIWYAPTNAGMLEFSSYDGAGSRQVNSGSAKYPSVDGGTTNLISPFQYQTSGTISDWTSAGTDPLTGTYSQRTPSAATVRDIQYMTVTGWTLSHNCRVSAGL